MAKEKQKKPADKPAKTKKAERVEKSSTLRIPRSL